MKKFERSVNPEAEVFSLRKGDGWISPMTHLFQHIVLMVANQMPGRSRQARPEWNRDLPSCDSRELAVRGLVEKIANKKLVKILR